MLRIAHISDQHHEIEKLDRCRQSHESIFSSLKSLPPVDLIIDTGDFWNRKQTLNKASAFLFGIEALKEFAEIAPIVMIKGNNEHDAEGSIEWLYDLKTKNPIYFAERAKSILFAEVDGRPSFLEIEAIESNPKTRPIALLHLVPYPTKANFLTGVENISIDESNLKIKDSIKQMFLGFGLISQVAQCPVILMAHCNVSGAELSNGQILLGQDILIGKHDLELARANYYALGHIHKAQALTPIMYYAGSTYHCNWGETEKKSFNLISIENIDPPINLPTIQQIEINSRPLAIHECGIENGELDDGGPILEAPDWINAHLRVRLMITKEQAGKITDEDIKKYYPDAFDYQIERIIIPEERIRSSQIVNALKLADKVKEWAKVIGKDLPPEIFALADEIEGSATK